MRLTVDKEFQALIPPLAPDEFARLEQDIVKNGCMSPLVLWSDENIILDGHNRYAICQKHDIDYSVIWVRDLKNRNDAKIWMVNNQLGRRNLTDFAKTELMLKIKPLLSEKAKENQLRGTSNLKKGTESPVCQNFDRPGIGRVNEVIAKKADVSRMTVSKVEKILESGNQAVIEKARSGEISINKAHNIIKPKPEPKPVVVEPIVDDEVFEDEPTLEEILDETVKENERLQKQIEALSADDTKAELVKEQAKFQQLSKHCDALGFKAREAERANARLRKSAKIVFELQKILGVDMDGIIDEVKRLKGVL